ncbi:hypothetical protein [Halobacillus ihumii]|uniref:hypothetical protein n=1 Tax=Halobacillus ihumii TaxID=2686092 RepID=UPI0013D6F0A9|nr:hypothetical protein [Halobacillus ihumii]
MIYEQEYKTAHIIEQLNKLGFNDTEGLTYDELKRKLAVARALEVDLNSDDNKWF